MSGEPVQELTVVAAGPVLTITFNRPTRLNAVTTTGLNDLADLLGEGGADDEVRVVVITGNGRAFSSGADLGSPDLNGPTDTEDEIGIDTVRAANRVVRALRAMPQPTIAMVNGPAVGVGCSLVLACDLAVMAESAYLLLPFTSIGLMPDGGATALVPASIGRTRALHMALVPDRVSAEEALGWGLVYRVAADGELASTVSRLVERLVAGAPRALAATKRAINNVTLDRLEAALAAELAGQSTLVVTADFREALAAFAEDRAARFKGS